MKVLGTLLTAAACICGATNANAQEFTVQGDFVSSYVWRGMYQTGMSVQSTLGFNVGGFSLTAWGSTDFEGVSAVSAADELGTSYPGKEFDLTAAYKFGEAGPTLSVTDYWWAGQGAKKYFHYKSHETSHFFEAGLAYTLPIEKFPLSIGWYTMFAGADKKVNDNGELKQNYTSYAELNYPFQVKGVDLNATCGMVPYKSALYMNNGFAVTNLALKASKEIKISDSFSLPIFTQVIWNPCVEDTHIVFGITLKP